MIISLAFVGGMFSAVYAGPVIATITLDGNVHTTGDSIVDGDLSVGGVSFAALDARIAALEGSTVPMVIANDAMIATQGNTLVAHDTMILTNQADIVLNQADIATNSAAIESGGGGPNPCDPDGDGAFTAQELLDHYLDNGVQNNLSQVQQSINNVENNIVTSNDNGVLDSAEEVGSFNVNWLIPFGVPACVYP